MKKFIICHLKFAYLILICLLPYLLIALFNISIQASSKQAYEDYLYQYNLYRQAHQEYILAKNKFLTYKTLSAKTDALDKTKKILWQRNEALIAYLQLLSERVGESEKISPQNQNTYYSLINQEISWLRDHNTQIASAINLSDVSNISQKMEERFIDIKILSYKTTGLILTSEQISLHQQINNQRQAINDKISHIKAEGGDVTTLERWLIDAQSKEFLSSQKIQQATAQFNNLSAKKTDEEFGAAKQLLIESHQYLKEEFSNLKEIISKNE